MSKANVVEPLPAAIADREAPQTSVEKPEPAPSRSRQEAWLVRPSAFEKVTRLHQYYRDCLSQQFEFPGIGKFPREFVQWVIGSSDSARLAELLAATEDSGLTGDHELAFALMLFTTQMANLMLDANNNFIEQTPPAVLVDGVRRGVERVLALHPHESYVVNAGLLLYRVKAIDEFFALSRLYPNVFQKSVKLKAILGFILTIMGEYREGLRYVQQVSQDPAGRSLPLMALSEMTCRYFLGESPNSPVTFETLPTSTATLAQQIAGLAPLEMIRPLQSPLSCPVVFAACNDRYFYQHAINLAASIHATNTVKPALHLHLFSPNPGMLADIETMRQIFPGLQIGVSTEHAASPLPFPLAYYSTARFIRAYQVLLHYKSELCIIDADAMFNLSWGQLSAQFGPKTELALACNRNSPFWESVTAAMIYCKPTPLAEQFLAKVAQFIARNIETKTAVWFTDQIALSACDDRFTKDHPAVSHVPSERLIDTNHHALAPAWALCTRKTGLKSYDLMRESLARKYGYLPSVDRDWVLSYVGRVKAPVFFVQIGAMDGASYDPIHPHVKAQGWRGLLVEPLPDMMSRLRATYAQQAGLTFENVAITEQEETRTMYRVTVETIQKAGLPYWLAGMSTFVPGKLDQYKPHVSEQPVSCIPLGNLLAKHKIEKIDVLQIDAEGYDFKILKQFDFSRYLPSIVNFEFVNLNAQDLAGAESLLLANGYRFYRQEQDIFAIHKELFFFLNL